jgi:hypothetical protein
VTAVTVNLDPNGTFPTASLLVSATSKVTAVTLKGLLPSREYTVNVRSISGSRASEPSIAA